MNKIIVPSISSTIALLVALIPQFGLFKDDKKLLLLYLIIICVLSIFVVFCIIILIVHSILDKIIKEKQTQFENMERTYKTFINSGQLPKDEKKSDYNIPADNKNNFGTTGQP